MMEEDGFQLVSRKKAARVLGRSFHSNSQGVYEGASTAEILGQIDELKQVLLQVDTHLSAFILY